MSVPMQVSRIDAVRALRDAGWTALLAFGLDSVIDGSASAALVWRFRLKLRRPGRPARAERAAGLIL